jgi:hypothetical protein
MIFALKEMMKLKHSKMMAKEEYDFGHSKRCGHRSW